MSVYFRGMEIPKNCIDCYNKNIHHHVHMLVGCPYIEEAFHSFDFRKERHPDCHLTGVLPDCRLIDAEYLIEHIKACFQNGREMHSPDLAEVLAMIDEIPTIIPAEDSDHEER